MAKLKPISISFDETLISKEYFEFNRLNAKRPIKNIIYYMIFKREFYQMYYSILIKYLLHIEKIHPILIEEVIRKHAVLLFYSWLKDVASYNVSIPAFDELLSKELKPMDLLKKEAEGDYPLVLIFNKEEGDKYKDYIKSLKKELSYLYDVFPSNKKNPLDIIVNVLNKDYLFFSLYHFHIGNLKSDSERERRFEQLIAESIEDFKFIRFNLQIDLDNVEKYVLNFSSNSNADLLKRYSIVFGIFVNEIIKNDNYSFDKSINLKELKKLNYFAKEDDISLLRLKFLNSKAGEINKDNIVAFKFKYNDVDYEISSKGIKKI